MMKYASLLLVAVLLSACSNHPHSHLERAKAAAEQNDYETAVYHARLAVEEGSDAAQILLAHFLTAAGDRAEAYDLLERLGEEDNAEALFWLGLWQNLFGEPGAVENLTRASDLGYPEAQSVLGMMYVMGRGVEPDSARAMELFYAAAEQGDDGAIRQLNSMRHAGLID
jgi:TPR repeat protein